MDRRRLQMLANVIAGQAPEVRQAWDDLIGEHDQLRTSRTAAHRAADAAGEAIGNMSVKLSAMFTEEDRLRAEAEFERGRADGYKLQRKWLREVIEAAVRFIEQAQFSGRVCSDCTETYRILLDESIALEPEPFDTSEEVATDGR